APIRERKSSMARTQDRRCASGTSRSEDAARRGFAAAKRGAGLRDGPLGSPGKGGALLALGSAFALAALSERFLGALLGRLSGLALGHQLGLLLDRFFFL